MCLGLGWGYILVNHGKLKILLVENAFRGWWSGSRGRELA
jgi:hypothetical protein